jgi:hypothetical protein
LTASLVFVNIRSLRETKEFIIKMEGNTGEFLDISGSEIHGGRCVQSLPGFLSED